MEEDYNSSRQASPAAVVVGEVSSLGGRNKYGELTPKKKPLISKDHERAFFDSADWALYKHGGGGTNQTLAIAMETLQPKLQKTPHQQLPPRRPTCTSG